MYNDKHDDLWVIKSIEKKKFKFQTRIQFSSLKLNQFVRWSSVTINIVENMCFWKQQKP